jgi:hypothetical protein
MLAPRQRSCPFSQRSTAAQKKHFCFAVQTKRLERKNENSDKHSMTSENVVKAEQKSHAER